MSFARWLRHPLASLREWNEERMRRGLAALKYRYQIFRALLEDNHHAISLLTEVGAKLRAGRLSPSLAEKAMELTRVVGDMIEKQEHLSPESVRGLTARYGGIVQDIGKVLARLPPLEAHPFCLPLDEIDGEMVPVVGSKAANLGALKRMRSLLIPDGFVITAAAGRFFLEKSGAALTITKIYRPFLERQQVPAAEALSEVRDLILGAHLPDALVREIDEVSGPLFAEADELRLAVRSSAVSEDSRLHSFAGQYETVLNVRDREALLVAVKQVIASSFSGRNISYRIHAGLDPMEFDLAVLCLEMVEARCSGTLFTHDPSNPDSGRMLVSAVYGLGELAVSGSGSADIYYPPRFGDKPPLSVIARKNRRIVMLPDGGTATEAVPEELRDEPVLDPDRIRELARAGIAIEMHFGVPQDIEWAIDEQDRLVILQSRPFRVSTGSARFCVWPRERLPLLEGGVASSSGEGIGRAHLVRRREDLRDLPEGPQVLVLRQSLPEAVEVLDSVAALVVELGNPVDHLSCVAREYSIPMLTGMENATRKIEEGTWLMVNANQGEVYEATEEEAEHARRTPLRQRPKPEDHIPDDPLLKTIYEAVVPLHLTDAYGPTFSIRECRSLHDIIRYIHEKAVLAMFESGDELIDLSGSAVRHLSSDVPFLVSLIDLGGGLAEGPTRGRRITVEKIRSIPFLALWRGISTPGLQWGPPGGETATGGVMSRWLTDHRSAHPIGMPNYAVITRDYLNLNARMDFHFIMVDTLCGFDPRSNYIRFRFKGGGTTLVQRRRRAQCIAEILEAGGFFCNVQDDLITADLHGGSVAVIEENLVTVGRLLGFTRLLDAVMVDDDAVHVIAGAFLAGRYSIDIPRQEGETAQA
ncbi:MAG: PEP/pyruvate-binding domain-containing protein [Desulfobulbaceae bacterium]